MKKLINLKIKNHRVPHKPSRNIYKVSAMKNLSYKQVKRLIFKITDNIPNTYMQFIN